MLRKIAKILGVSVLLCALAVAAYWQFNKERLQAEYKAYCKTAAPILIYHAVGPAVDIEWPKSLIMPTAVFEKHMQYLHEEGYKIISVRQLGERLRQNQSVEKHLALTFDDGYKNNYSEVLPVLKKYNAQASFFVISNKIGKKIYMNEEEIKDLIAQGMEIGSHTVNHAPLAEIEEKFLPWEISGVRRMFRKRYDGYDMVSMAYPNGSYNQKVAALAKRFGHLNGLTGIVGAFSQRTFLLAPMELYRVTIADDGSNPQYLAKRLERAYLWGFLQTKGIDLNIIRERFM